jgi:hypothetical protein
MSFRPNPRSLSTSVQMSLDSWVFRSDSAFPVDLMILTKSADHCDTLLANQTSSILMSLPLELVTLIGRALDPIDMVCFTLSCKRAACAVGIKSWSLFNNFTGLREGRWKLLRTLNRDLPDYHLCFYAGRLCKISSATSAIPCRRRRRIEYEASNNGDYNESKSAQNLRKDRVGIPTFCDMQLLLEKHMYGSTYDFTVKDFTFTEPWGNQWQSRQHRGSKPHFDKSGNNLDIVGNELRVYTAQHCVIDYIPKHGGDPDDLSLHDPFNWYDFGMPICNHRRRDSSDRDIFYSTTQAVKVNLFENKQTCWQSPAYKCPMCPKFFRFAAFNHPEHTSLELAVQCVQIFAPKEGSAAPDWDEHANNWIQYNPGRIFNVTPTWPACHVGYVSREPKITGPYAAIPQQEEKHYFGKYDLVSAFNEDVVKQIKDRRRIALSEKLGTVKERVSQRTGLSWAKWHLVTAPKNAYQERKQRKA